MDIDSKKFKFKIKGNNRFVYILILAVIISLAASYLLYNKNFNKAACSTNFFSAVPSTIGGDFTLTNTDNEKKHSSEIITDPSLIYFGYSYCPDVCPFDLQRNVIAVDILADLGLTVSPIFITIDPERDSTTRLKAFSEFVHPKLIALTGSQAEINTVLKTFKVYAKKSLSAQPEGEDYLMDHSAFTYLVSSSNKFLDFFKRETAPQEMADRINCILN